MSGWRSTWRATVESFLREIRGSERDVQRDAMADAIEEARGALARAVDDLELADVRCAGEEQAEAACRRRADLARRIGDDETATIAESFAARHSERAAVLRRKSAILLEEAALWRRDAEEMLTLYRQEDGAAAGYAGSEDAAQGPARADRGGGPGPVDRLGVEFAELDDARRQREAERRLDEMKQGTRDGAQ